MPFLLAFTLFQGRLVNMQVRRALTDAFINGDGSSFSFHCLFDHARHQPRVRE
jgi:hypothetical protein